MLKIATISMVILTEALSGCTEIITKESGDTELAKAIVVSAAEIHKDLLQLTRLKELSPHTSQVRATPTTGALSKKLSLKIVGQPEGAIKTISALIGFAPPKTAGKRPANEGAIMINAINKPAAEILDDIGLQMGRNSGISIGHNQITIIYEGAHE